MPLRLINSSSTPSSFSFDDTASFSLIIVSLDLLISSAAVSSSIASILAMFSGVDREISSILGNPSDTKS